MGCSHIGARFVLCYDRLNETRIESESIPDIGAVFSLGHRMNSKTQAPTQQQSKEIGMSNRDNCCSIAPYFKVSTENLPKFKDLCARFVESSSQEDKCLYYGFTFDGEHAHCREGYADAEGLLAHLANVGPLLEEALQLAEITRLEIHGPAGELDKLRTPLAGLNPQFFILECGFRQ
jgi:quinol monooxygenase YgiN